MNSMSQALLRLIFSSALVAAVAGSCAHSPEWDKKVGAQASNDVEAKIGLYNDPKLTAYVNDTGQKIVTQIPDRQFDFEFQIIDQPVANAFSLPGGHVYVTRGLLALTESPDELASVLGHEAAHVTKRHAAQRMEAATVPEIFSLPGAVVGTIAPTAGDLLAAPAQNLGAVFLAGYSRDQEREADRIGQELAERAGFDPHAMPEFLDRLGQSEALTSKAHDQRIPEYLQTHPQTPERVSAAQKRADKLAAITRSPQDRDAYVDKLDGLVLGDNPESGIFVDDMFMHPVQGFAFAAPRGWLRVNLPVAVVVVSKQQDGAVLLDRPRDVTNPDQAAQRFIDELRRQSAAAPAVESLTISDLPARRISVSQRDGKTVTYLDVTWLLHRGVTYRLVAVAMANNLSTVRATVQSFHDLTAAERLSIKVTRLRVTQVRPGETLAEASRRTDNQWDAKTTALMNGIDPNAPLRAGQRIKVAQTDRFAPP
jgi:predicted Zn-dependent protease